MSVICETNETEEMKVGKFIGGLREDLRRKIDLTPNLTFSLACSNALTLFKYSKKKTSTRSTYNRPMRNPNLRNVVNPTHTSNQTTTQEKTSSLTITPRDRNTTDLKRVLCFKCHGHDHIKSECPNARAFTLQEWTKIIEEGPRVMLVSRNEGEEVVWPSTSRDDPDGSYFVNDEGVLETLRVLMKVRKRRIGRWFTLSRPAKPLDLEELLCYTKD